MEGLEFDFLFFSHIMEVENLNVSKLTGTWQTSVFNLDTGYTYWKGFFSGYSWLNPKPFRFRLTANKLASEKGWTREAIIRLSAAVDLACWDIVGKAANLPLYKLFGGFKDEVPCYATCGYYREGKDEQELRDDLQMMVDQGHKGFKVKIGGLSLKEDMERLRVIREVIGEKDLMVDVNRAWDYKTACDVDF